MIRWAGHVACIEVMRIAYVILVRKPQGLRPLWKPGDNTKICLKETEC